MVLQTPGPPAAAHPSVRVLGGLVVVPEPQAGDELRPREGDAQGGGGGPAGEGDQPHVVVLRGDVMTVHQPDAHARTHARTHTHTKSETVR